tara:strand:- start:27233 stop:28033 length:801 start_codon:yes stop_codon:yes gene_type:complete
MSGKFKIKVDEMKKLLSLISLSGQTEEGGKDYIVKDFVMKIEGNKGEVVATDKTGKVFVKVIKTLSMVEPGKICVGNISLFEKFLDRFDLKDEVEVNQDSGYLVVKRREPKMMVRFLTSAEDNIESKEMAQTVDKIWKFEEEKVVSEKGTTLNAVIGVRAEDIHSIALDSEVVNEATYPVEVLKNDGGYILKVDVGDIQTGVIRREIPTSFIKVDGEVKSKYAFGFRNVFDKLKGDVKLFFQTNLPMWVIKKDEDLELFYMLSPVS